MLLAQAHPNAQIVSGTNRTPAKRAEFKTAQAVSPTNPLTSQQAAPQGAELAASPVWMYSSGALGLLLIGLGVMSAVSNQRLVKKLKFETVKNRELHRKLTLAVETIGKMERNPDLIHSREFNLDYLRMRMDEPQFRFSVVNQIKVKIKDKISLALRPSQAHQGELGIASTGRQIDEVFEVEYQRSGEMASERRVLFRVQVKLVKLPTQATSVTVAQLISCIETFLSPTAENDSWQPTIQGRLANLHWDQKAKPTPLLVLEQTQEGSNVTFRANRMAGAKG
jgi:hypothetical protein